MKAGKLVIALLLTLALLYVAGANSRGRSEFYSHSENGLTLEIFSVPKGIEMNKVAFSLTVKGDLPKNSKVVIRTSKFGQDINTALYKYQTTPMKLIDTAAGLYESEVMCGLKGGRQHYYFEVRDNVGGRLSLFTAEEEKPFVLKFIGEVPLFILIGHLFFIFASAFAIVMTSLEGIKLARSSGSTVTMAKYILWATFFMFMGGYPFGFGMNYYAFNGFWEGVPFGTDATDNKTQIIFVYLLFMMFATIGSCSKGKCGRDIFSDKTLGYFGIGTFFVMLAMYLIPHSIQFDPTDTKVVCWSFNGLMALIWLVGFVKSRETSINKKKKIAK